MSSGGTSSSAGFKDYQSACQAIASITCQAEAPCTNLEGADAGGWSLDGCLAAEYRKCEFQNQNFVAAQDAGFASFVPEAASACVDFYQRYFAEVGSELCRDELLESRTLYRAWYGTRTCQDDAEKWIGANYENFYTCFHLVKGTVPEGGGCGTFLECESQDCTAADGGCGTCKPVENMDWYVRAGQTCVEHTPGEPRRYLQCTPGATCDEGTETCLPTRRPGESCGVGIGECSRPCGYGCKDTRDGGFCQPLPGGGEPCPEQQCAPGHTCVLLNQDGGPAWYCRTHADLGQPCGIGSNQDDPLSPGYNTAGGVSNTAEPVCKPGLVCELNADEVIGTCRSPGPRHLDESCQLWYDDCVDPETRCRSTAAGYKCTLNNTLGGPCSSDLDCAAGFACWDDLCGPVHVEGEPCYVERDCQDGMLCWDGLCTPSRATGESCFEDWHCAELYSSCYHGQCQVVASLEHEPAPMCQ